MFYPKTCVLGLAVALDGTLQSEAVHDAVSESTRYVGSTTCVTLGEGYLERSLLLDWQSVARRKNEVAS